MKQRHPFRAWNKNWKPKRILVLRFHALGDIVITLPYLNSLKKQMPEAAICLLTRLEFSDLPKSLTLFDEVITFDDHRNGKFQFLRALTKLPLLWSRRYDIVLDLQTNRTSRTIRNLLYPAAWSEFDKVSHRPAAERTRACINQLCLCQVDLQNDFVQRVDPFSLTQKLRQQGWDNDDKIVTINPCGGFATRNWPIENYAQFCKLWLTRFPKTQFLVMGTSPMRIKAAFLKEILGGHIIDLTGLTSQSEAFALIRMNHFVVTEDGGLMHMAWVQSVPTLALFGSTATYWSAPQGVRSVCLNSSDLPCGNCMLEVCRYGDNRCLTRYTPEFVFEKSVGLLSSLGQ